MIRVNDMFDVEWQEGMTVADVLEALGWDYALIAVSVADTLVHPDSYHSHPVPDGTQVTAIHIAHGG